MEAASSELCVIDYFSVAAKRGRMLYLRSVPNQCPQGPPVREFFPPQRCSRRFGIFQTEERGILATLETANEVRETRKGAGHSVTGLGVPRTAILFTAW